MKMRLLFVLSFLFLIHTTYGQEIMMLKPQGKVVIGDTAIITTPGNYNLYVQNGILTERVKVAVKSSSDWADDAFDKAPTLEEVNASIQQKSHLIGLPSVEELVKDGYELKDMDAKLLTQIEWLWVHMIKLEEENKALREELLKYKQK